MIPVGQTLSVEGCVVRPVREMLSVEGWAVIPVGAMLSVEGCVVRPVREVLSVEGWACYL